MQQADERLKFAENEKNYYKSRATEAIEDLDRGKTWQNNIYKKGSGMKESKSYILYCTVFGI